MLTQPKTKKHLGGQSAGNTLQAKSASKKNRRCYTEVHHQTLEKNTTYPHEDEKEKSKI